MIIVKGERKSNSSLSNSIRAIELENGLKFGVLNDKTNEWEHFEFQDDKYLGLEEYKAINEFGEEVSTFIRTGDVFDKDYIINLPKEHLN